MNVSLYLLIYNVFIFTIFSSAFGCEDIRLDTNGQALENVPVFDQGTTSACYAFAASLLIDAYRFSSGSKRKDFSTSPLVLGARSGDILTGGGNIDEALLTAQRKGVCNNKEIEKYINSKNSHEFIETLVKYHAQGQGKAYINPLTFKGIKSISSKSVSFSEEPINIESLSFNDTTGFSMAQDWQPKKKILNESITYNQDQVEAAKNLATYLCKQGLYGTPENELLEFISKSRVYFMDAILKSICKDRIKFKNLPDPVKVDGLKLYSTGYQLPSETDRIHLLRETIESKISENKPVAIEFCNETVTSSGHKGMYNKFGEWVCENNGQHAAVIVGSKKNILGQCSYLVRDSFCSQYQRPKKSGQMNKSRGVCRDGQYWISSDRLLKNTRAAIYLNY